METTPQNSVPITADILEPASEGRDPLPVPQGPRRDLGPPEKQSFWKRLSGRSRQRDELALQGQDINQICNRLTLVETRIGTLQESFDDRLRALEQRLDEVWEAEEQLSHLVDLQSKLDQLLTQQQEMRESTSKSSSNAGLWALVGVLTLALAAALGGFVQIG